MNRQTRGKGEWAPDPKFPDDEEEWFFMRRTKAIPTSSSTVLENATAHDEVASGQEACKNERMNAHAPNTRQPQPRHPPLNTHNKEHGKTKKERHDLLEKYGYAE